MTHLEKLLAESKEMTDNTKYLLGYESVLIRTQSEIIAVLAEAFKIAAHRHHIDCDKFCVGCCPIFIKKEALQKAESLAKEVLEK